MRAKRKLIKVTFPNGKIFCYANVTNTMLSVLKEIGSDKFHGIKLELGHFPLISNEVNPRFGDYIKPICDGWYLNSQSDTTTKYLQLRAINESLNLNLKIEIGEGFEVQAYNKENRQRNNKTKLLVRFPTGEFVIGESPIETFIGVIRKFGIDNIMRRDILWGSNPIITLLQKSPRQIKIDENRWIMVPMLTKDKAKLLKVIAMHMKTNLEITII